MGPFFLCLVGCRLETQISCLGIRCFIMPNSSKRSNFWRLRRRGVYRVSSNSTQVYRPSTNSSLVLDGPSVLNKEPVLLAACPKSSPYPGWLLYFPGLTFESDSTPAKYTKILVDFIETECLSETTDTTPTFSQINWTAVEECSCINVDFESLKSSSLLAREISGWPPEPDAKQLFDAKQLLSSLGLAVHTVATKKLYASPNEEAKLPYIAARLVNHHLFIPMRSLRAHHLGNLVSLRATVARLGSIRPLCCRLCFRCALCESEQVVVLEETGCFVNPTKCPTKGCRSKIFYPFFSSPSTLVIDTQIVLLQESDEDENFSNHQSTTGRVPHNLICFVDRDLVDACVPGDFVHVCGIVSLLSATSDATSLYSAGVRRPFSSTQEASGSRTNVFNLCLRVNNLTRIFSRAGEGSDCTKVTQCLTTRHQDSCTNEEIAAKNLSSVNDIQTADAHFSVSDLYAIRGIAEESNLFNLLITSFCPSIYGRELVKMAILLAAFGGSANSWGLQVQSSQKTGEKSPDLSMSSDDEGERVSDALSVEIATAPPGALTISEDAFVRRCSSHVLLVGDPGIGKSQLLRAAASVAPRAVYVCGNTTSAAGLTVSACRDNSSFGLEAGALVLADQGICCIDEFDKISCDPAALLEVLEQQTVSVARGGYVCNLAARTSVLAAANPVVGHYDSSKTIYENVRISRSLISRFDLIFILPDRPSENLDRRLSEHVLALHMGQRMKGDGINTISFSVTLNESDSGANCDNLPLENRLRIGTSNRRLIPPHLLRKYITYARAYVHPRMTQEAAQFIHDFYLKLRKRKIEDNDLFQVTIRQLESLIRLSSARARAELREEITKQDARDVCDLMLETGYGTSQSPGLNGAISTSFISTKKRKNASATGVAATKCLLSALHREASRPGASRIFTTQEIAGIAAQIGLSGDDSILYQRCTPGGTLSILIDNLNNIGALLKRGVDQYSLV
ncbi:dna replication licensing factor mcm8 [Echinococcus multilocularis]|uniref:DNA helicase n=1 Tax=Echinococcus multilocularis TaxID=6211 RepID=A0A068Y6K5_ECHMU|nr:dna replication licensing factor mcm8 [Echinococcus multilocularis]